MAIPATAETPSSIDDITVDWLTAVLRADASLPAMATVTAVRAEQIAMDTGFSSLLYRLHLTGSDGVPTSIIVKLPAQSEARGAMDMMEGYVREVSFYQLVAGRAPIGVPHPYYAQLTNGPTNFVLVLEDLQDWENADYRTGVTLQRARACISHLAGLHAWSAEPGNAEVLAAFPGVGTQVMRELLPSVFGIGWQAYKQGADVPIPASVEAFAERFAEHAPKALDALTERSMLVHGDFRADNLFFAAEELKVVDFQFAARGVGTVDIAYLVSQGVPTELRDGRDEELVRGYLCELEKLGVEDYSFDEAWRHYRLAVGFLMVLPVVALLGAATMPERARELCMTLIERSVATFDAVDAAAVFADATEDDT